MKKTASMIAVGLLAATLTGCLGNGGGPGDTQNDTYPYHSGKVVGKTHDVDGYALRLQTVIAKGTYTGWQPVNQRVYSHCQAGEHWQERLVNGC